MTADEGRSPTATPPRGVRARLPPAAILTIALPLGALQLYTAGVEPWSLLRSSYLVPGTACILAGVILAVTLSRGASQPRTLLLCVAAGALVALSHVLAGSGVPYGEGLGNAYLVLVLVLLLERLAVGAIAGLSLGVTLLPLLGALDDEKRGASRDGGDHLLFRASLWLGVAAALASLRRPSPVTTIVAAAAVAGLCAVLVRKIGRLLGPRR